MKEKHYTSRPKTVYSWQEVNISLQAISNFSWFMTGVNVPSPVTLTAFCEVGQKTFRTAVFPDWSTCGFCYTKYYTLCTLYAFPASHIPIPSEDEYKGINILTGNEDVPHREWGYDSPTMHIHPDREWGCA